MKVFNTTRGSVLMAHGQVANSFLARGIGLLGHKNLAVGEGLIIIPNSSVHCFFMRFPIDVVFVSKSNRIVHIYHTMKPWRASKIVKDAHYVIEVEAGVAAKTNTQVGDLLQWQDETSGQAVDWSKSKQSAPSVVKSNRL